jgi:hypothetical protein
MPLGNKIAKLVSYPLLLAVYGAFFCIQVGSHYDIAGNVYFHVRSTMGAGASRPAIKKERPASIKVVAVRVNKRCQPASAPGLLTCLLPLAAVSVDTRVVCCYSNPAVSSIFLGKHPLRGPPVLA